MLFGEVEEDMGVSTTPNIMQPIGKQHQGRALIGHRSTSPSFTYTWGRSTPKRLGGGWSRHGERDDPRGRPPFAYPPRVLNN
jgi:hypothetical protein